MLKVKFESNSLISLAEGFKYYIMLIACVFLIDNTYKSLQLKRAIEKDRNVKYRVWRDKEHEEA